ncbi:MAG: hypothetical protein KBA31_13645 [Alphaproteobacteria bacterium]|nr:hypothetical protein [Alphaproteobacteria bacterium]
MTNRRLDPATFQALQALIAHGGLRVGECLARAIRERRQEIGVTAARFANHGIDDIDAVAREGATISAPMLVNLAGALDVDLVWFIEREPAMLNQRPADTLDVNGVLLGTDEGLELLRAFAAIRDEDARKKVLELAQHFAGVKNTN